MAINSFLTKNPVIETYKGVHIRRTNVVKMAIGIVDFKRLIDEADQAGVSIPKVLYYSGRPCERCKDTNVYFLDKDGNEQKIKRGILSLPESNGANIIQKAQARACKTQSK